MTWQELHGVLAKQGLVRTGPLDRLDVLGRVAGISYDSRHVQPGEVFIALKGQHADGSAFAVSAVEKGAAGVVSEDAAPAGIRVPWLRVENARVALALLSVAFYGNPTSNMRVVGITGTNGKTTTAYLVASIFDAARVKCGILGTVAYRIGDEEHESTRTTPEAPDVQRMLRAMVDKGCRACA